MADIRRARLSKAAFWIPLAVATVFALLPKGPPLPFAISDILLHAFAFTYLTAALGFAHYSTRTSGLRIAPTVCWMLAYGVALEAIQSLIPERSAELKDIVVDGVGIVLGLALWRGVMAWCRRRTDYRRGSA